MATKTIRDLENQLMIEQEALDLIYAQYESRKARVDALQIAISIMEEASATEQEEEATTPKVMRNAMVEIIREEDEPLHYTDIYDKLVERGIKVPGQDPRRNVGAHLSNDQRFEKYGNGLWGLASWKRLSNVSLVEQRDRNFRGSYPRSTIPGMIPPLDGTSFDLSSEELEEAAQDHFGIASNM